MSAKQQVVVLGAGVGGLSAGWMFGRSGAYDVKVIERASVTGGICGTFRHEEFLLDYGPHKSYSAIDGVLEELRTLMGNEFLVHEKKNTIYLFGSFLTYPVRMLDLASKMGVANVVITGVSAVGAMIGGKADGRSYEEYAVSKFGRKIYELVFEPLADKIWGDPATLSADIARTRIPSTSVLDVALRAIGLRKETSLTDAKYFYYPRRGFGRIPDRMEEEIRRHGGQVLTRATPKRIELDGKRVTGVDVEVDGQTRRLPCDLLISSIPLDVLVTMLGGGTDPRLAEPLQAAKKLQYRTAFLVYVFIDAEMLTNHHWLFFPERDIIFGRVFEQKRMSPEMSPAKKTVLCCDFTDYEGGRLWSKTDEELARLCINDLEKVGLVDRSKVTGTLVRRLPRFYPRYDLTYKETTAALYRSLKQYDNLFSTGRIGFYNYNNSDHCVDMGRFLARSVLAGIPTAEIWSLLEQRVADYRIVD